VEKLILKKRPYPNAMWDEDDECFRVPGGPAFTAQLFHEAPPLLSCASIKELSDQWEVPASVVSAIFKVLSEHEMN
jgi:hypothetical protein